MPRFKFAASPIWCSDNRLLFNIDATIGYCDDFLSSYPSKERIIITFKDKDGYAVCKGEASIITGHRINILKALRFEYYSVFKKEKHLFAFNETKHGEWIAKQL